MTNVNERSRSITYIRVSAVAPLIERQSQHRSVVAQLLSRHGISLDELADPYAVVPLHHYVALLEDAAQALDDPFLGARFGAELKPADIGPMGILFSLAPSIRDGFDRISRYVNSLQNATNSGLSGEGDMLIWSYRINDKAIWPRRQDAEYSVVATCQLVRSCFSQRWSPVEVHFEHVAPPNADYLRRIIKAPVRFAQSGNRIVMDKSEAARIYRTEDKQLAMVLERHIGDLIRQNPPDDDLVAKVRSLIDLYLGRRAITVGFLADELGLAPRSLQRHLQKAGVSLGDLLRTHRRELATRMLSDGTVRIVDVAHALGYTDGATFCRAFKEWTGVAPSAVASK